MTDYRPANQPTLHFIGVTTAKSSIMKVFPAWANYLGLKDAAINGIDFPLHADPAAYRAAASFIKSDPLSLGALVTTHKIDFYRACRDIFDEVDAHAQFMGETSCLSKRNGRFVCHAKDAVSAGLALDGFIPSGHFANRRAEWFSMGAGGATIALTWHVMGPERGTDRPSRIVISDPSAERLAEIQHFHARLGSGIATDYVRVSNSTDNDAVLSRLKPGSLVINATGLGKDAPGSPISGDARFPDHGIAWDLNYRGDLVFLEQAWAQMKTRNLQVEDGWTYFIHGWTQVIAEVFHIDIPTAGPRFNEIAAIAAAASGKR
jgi:shikimate 5-dehydrogenase